MNRFTIAVSSEFYMPWVKFDADRIWFGGFYLQGFYLK